MLPGEDLGKAQKKEGAESHPLGQDLKCLPGLYPEGVLEGCGGDLPLVWRVGVNRPTPGL